MERGNVVVNREFVKYLGQYLLLLILPITILILFFFRVTLNSFTHEVLIRQDENLRMTQAVFDDLLRRAAQLNNELETDPIYSPNYISLGLVNIMEVQKRLEKLSRQSLYINDIIVYYHSLDTVVSNHGHYTYPDFLRYGVEFENMDGSELDMLIQENQYTAVIPRQYVAINRGQPALAMGIANTFREHSDFYRQTVLSIIDCSLLERQLIGHYKEFAGATLIVSGEELIGQFGNIVFDGKQLEEIFILLKEGVKGGRALLKLDKNSYMAQITHSGYFGMNYISIIDQQTLNSKLRAQIHTFSLSLLAVLLLGIPVISFYMLKNYVPLRDLRTFIRLNVKEDMVRSNAAVAARQAIEQLQAEKQKLLGSSMEQWLNLQEDGQIALFDQALRHEQYNQALKLLGVICEKLEKESTSLFQVRCACYRLSDSILHAMRLNRGILEQQGLDLFSIAQETDIKMLTARIRKLAAITCSEKAADREEKDLELFVRRIHNYVAEHLETPGFSIQSMADHFNISAAGLSRRYKEATGANISDYIGKQVMDQAMELLKSSDIRISELAERFRFSTSSGFISFFKQRAGITPGVYQKIFRDNN